MNKTLIAALLLTAALPASAQLVLGANVVSAHNQPDLEWFTPGLYARYGGPWYAEAGVYRNSQGFASAHVGGGYLYQINKRWDVSVTAGVIYGYRDVYEWWYADGHAPNYKTYGPPKTQAFVIPSVGYALSDDWNARAFVIPPSEKQGSWCVSLALEWKL